MKEVVTAQRQRKLPVVLTPLKVRSLLLESSGVAGLVTSLLYGTGLRLMEGLRLRVKDIEFERRELIVRDGKGGKDRVTGKRGSRGSEGQVLILYSSKA